ncbi:MAG: hypothetical protein QNJ17_09185 [Desulfocapsaceae bacterium]|nr:hypothetical protein [Desulfocapsaceae bacterium]
MSSNNLYNLQSYIELHQSEDNLLVVNEKVVRYWKQAEIYRQVIANLFGTNKHLELAFTSNPQQIDQDVIHLAETIMTPTTGEHVDLEPPIVIDCQMKPWYTEGLKVDKPTPCKVDEKFHRIFPNRCQ